MKLYDIIKDVAKTSLPDMEISDVTSDTRKAVKAGSMFVCIKGIPLTDMTLLRT